MSKWISVEDRLPKECGYYLCLNGINEVPNVYCWEGRWYDEGQEITNMKFWQPLPEPPDAE